MKTEFTTTPDVSRQSEASPVLNETQRQLKAVLDYWGENGECWALGVGDGVTKLCFINALCFTQNNLRLDDIKDWVPTRYAETAAKEMGFSWYIGCSDSGFPNARKMVERAIVLAGSA